MAAIDCGTNSIRLLISDIDPAAGHATDVVPRRMEIVRLGQGVDRTGELAPEALERTFAACAAYAKEIDLVGGVAATRFVATSATRDARNRDVFVAGVRSLLGVEPDVVSGDEEATFSFVGATRELERLRRAVPRAGHRRRLDRVRARHAGTPSPPGRSTWGASG